MTVLWTRMDKLSRAMRMLKGCVPTSWRLQVHPAFTQCDSELSFHNFIAPYHFIARYQFNAVQNVCSSL